MQARHTQTRHRKSTDARGRHRHKGQDTSMGGPASAARGHRKMHKTARTARASQTMHETQPFLSKRLQRRTTSATAPRCRGPARTANLSSSTTQQAQCERHEMADRRQSHRTSDEAIDFGNGHSDRQTPRDLTVAVLSRKTYKPKATRLRGLWPKIGRQSAGNPKS